MRKSTKRNLTGVPEAPKPIIDTPRVLGAKLLERITHEANYDIEYSQKELDKFAARLTKDPSNAFEWSHGTFEQAARNHVAKHIMGSIKWFRDRAGEDEYSTTADLDIVQHLRKSFFEVVVRGARWPERSTSVQSNEIKKVLVARYAEWLVKLDGMLLRDQD
jgi:hypothetical protein